MLDTMNRRRFFTSLAAAILSIPLCRMLGAEEAKMPAKLAINPEWENAEYGFEEFAQMDVARMESAIAKALHRKSPFLDLLHHRESRR